MDPEKELLLHAIAIMTSQVMIHPLLTYVWSKVFAKAMLLAAGLIAASSQGHAILQMSIHEFTTTTFEFSLSGSVSGSIPPAGSSTLTIFDSTVKNNGWISSVLSTAHMEGQIIAADSGADLSSNVELFTIGSRSNPSWGDWIQLRNSNGSMDDLHFDDARFVVQGSFDPTVVGGFAIFWGSDKNWNAKKWNDPAGRWQGANPNASVQYTTDYNTPVPEPEIFALVLGLWGMVAAVWHRKRRRTPSMRSDI